MTDPLEPEHIVNLLRIKEATFEFFFKCGFLGDSHGKALQSFLE